MIRFPIFLMMLFAPSLLSAPPPRSAPPPQEEFIVLSEFQVWADAAGPHVFEALNRRYLEKGRSHIFNLYPRYDYFVWDLDRMKGWVDEAVELKAFNVFCIGDDTRTAAGHLFNTGGMNPQLADFFFSLVAYAHSRGLMVAVEPLGLPSPRDEAQFIPWLDTWVGPKVPAERRPDIIKLSLEWFDAYGLNPDIAREVEAFFKACEKVNPDLLIYIDSIGGRWRRPCPFHAWLLTRFPGTIVSHYLGTSQVEAFRAMGARNLMVQINPSEIDGKAGQFFIYHDRTVDFLKDAVQKKVRYLSLAGVNFGYSRYNYDLFLEVIRPHLRLARDLGALRASLSADEIVKAVTKAGVEASLREEKKAQMRKRWAEQPIPLNKAGRPAVFGETREDCFIQNLAAIADGKVAPRFQGAYTDSYCREPVAATFGRDFGEVKLIKRLRVIPCLVPGEKTYVASDFRLEYRMHGKWKVVPGGMFRHNEKQDITVDLDGLEADAVRLVIERESDDGKGNYRACCQELTVSFRNDR